VIELRKAVSMYSLEINGWHNMKLGIRLPSYCVTCDRQTIHVCTGIKTDGEAELVRLECLNCYKKLGIRLPFFSNSKKSKVVNGQLSES